MGLPQLLLVVLIALHAIVGSQYVFAHNATSTTPSTSVLNVRHESASTLATNTSIDAANATSVLTLFDECSRSTTDHHIEVELLSCQNELADSIQATKSLEMEVERLEKKLLRVVNETNTELDSLEEKTKRQEHQLKSKEDRYQDQRRRLLSAEAQLKQMHAAAASQYVNFTLMREDALGGIERTFSMVSRSANIRWGHHFRDAKRRFRPALKDANRRWNRRHREMSSSLRPKIASIKRNMQDRWARSTIVRPLLEGSVDAVSGPVHDVYQKYEPTIDEVRAACQLTVVSAIEETSKSAIHYLEKEERMKLEREERERNKSPLQKRLEYKRRNRRNEKQNQEVAPREANIVPSFINLRARVFFKYALANSEKLYDQGVALLPLAVALSVTGSCISCIIASILVFCHIPTQLIWIFVVVNFMRTRRTKVADE